MNQAALIDVRGLAVERDGQTILGGLSLQLQPAERLVVTGPVGSGKSTLLLALLGLLPYRAESLHILGVECRREADFVPLRGPVGLLFQDPDDQLLCPTVLEDVEFGPLNRGAAVPAAHAMAQAALARVGIGHLAARPVHALSGGEKRLVALAGLLAMQPRILLLDEPTASLDTQSVNRVIDVLEGTGLPMIIATHDPLCASRLASRTLALADGRILPD